MHSGSPYTVRLLGTASNNSGTGGNGNERPNEIGDPNLSASDRNPLHFFNTAAFVLPAAGTFGNAARNTVIGPWIVRHESRPRKRASAWDAINSAAWICASKPATPSIIQTSRG